MRIKNWSELYTFGYFLVSAGIQGFYKRHQVVGKENIPKNKPVIFSSNHQSAFMDPVVIAAQLSKPTYYMVRADIFKKKLAAKAFAAMNMMPIYRARDGGDTIKKNEVIFNECYDYLSKNRPIIIFPEGNHDFRKRLRPLKKGVFRIGYGAGEKYGKDIDVHVVPVGVNYSDNRNMGSTMLINFGKPIRLNDFWDDYETEQPKTVKKLMADLSAGMSDVLIDIQSVEYYDTIQDSIDFFDDEIYALEKIKDDALIDEFNAKKGFIKKVNTFIESNPDESEALKESVFDYGKLLNKHRLKSWLFRKKSQPIFLHLLILIIASPIHLYGMINHYLPYKLPVLFVEKKVKDTQFHSSIKMGMGAFLMIIFWTLQTVLVALFTDNYIWTYYLLSLPITAKISYWYWIGLLKLGGKFRYNKLKKANESEFNVLAGLRSKILMTFKKM